MTQTIDQQVADTIPGTDLVAAVLRVLSASPEPMTISKIRSKLPAPYRSASLEELADTLQRQVAANVLHQYPKYRSQQDRFWDRPMEVHLTALFREVLVEGPLGWAELRRKLPAYALDPLARAEAVLEQLMAESAVHRHPRAGKRGGDRFGLQPPDAKEYLRSELVPVFRALEQLGFTQAQLRSAALELLHDEEWALTVAAERPESSAQAEPETEQRAEEAPASAPASAPEAMNHAAPAPQGEAHENSSVAAPQAAPKHAPPPQSPPAESHQP
jgi:hypothetical protein